MKNLLIALLSLFFMQISCYQPYYTNSEQATRRTAASGSPADSIKTETGYAIFYADEMQGKKTASGEKYNMRSLVAAHRTWPLGAFVEVTNLSNKKSVRLRINDRGPKDKDKIIAVSFEAAKELEFITQGTTEVEIKFIK
jgi:rare lipoprotein A